MKKIIDGKKYDTETARFLGSYEYSYRSQFEWYREDLYQKKTGEFFIYGEGHAASKYAVSEGRNCGWSGGEKIIPMSADSAREWAEKYLEAEEYEKIFGEVVEDDSKRAVNLYLPTALVERLRRQATEQGVSLSDYIAARLETGDVQ